MAEPTIESLTTAKCVPCEGGVPKLNRAAAETFLDATPLWVDERSGPNDLTQSHLQTLCRSHGTGQSNRANRQSEGHHPDLHLTGYRNLKVDLMTHAIDGLSENDFILAAKIDQLFHARSIT